MRRILLAALTVSAIASVISAAASHVLAGPVSPKDVCLEAGRLEDGSMTDKLAGERSLANLETSLTQAGFGLQLFSGSDQGAVKSVFSVNAYSPGGHGGRGRIPKQPNVVGAPIPEPATLFLMGIGLAGVAAVYRRRLKTRRSRVKAK